MSNMLPFYRRRLTIKKNSIAPIYLRFTLYDASFNLNSVRVNFARNSRRWNRAKTNLCNAYSPTYLNYKSVLCSSYVMYVNSGLMRFSTKKKKREEEKHGEMQIFRRKIHNRISVLVASLPCCRQNA